MSSIWIRLPDLVCGIVCWLLLSREVLPRLGPAVAVEPGRGGPRPGSAGRLDALFNNGLRPEGQIATGALITYVLIERAIASGRMTPAALATLTAAFTLGIQPTGLIAVATRCWPAVDRSWRILVRRHRLVGTWPLVLPMLGRGNRDPDRRLRRPDDRNGDGSHQNPHRPSGPRRRWWTENLRYYYLDPADGRRIAVARVRLPDDRAGACSRRCSSCCGASGSWCGARSAWRYDGHDLRHDLLPAVRAASGGCTTSACSPRWAPRWRPLATVLVSRANVLRWSRNRMAFRRGRIVPAGTVFRDHQRMVVRVELRCAVQQRDAEDRPDVTVSTIFFALFALAAIWATFCTSRTDDAGGDRVDAPSPPRRFPSPAGFMVLVFVGSMLAGVVRQYPTYSNAWANLRAFTGGCGLADDVLRGS